MKIDDDIKFLPVHEDYAEEFLELALAIKAQGMNYCPEIVEEVENLEDSISWLKDYREKFEETGAPDFFIVYQGGVCGIIGFHPWEADQEWAEIAYWVAPHFQRLGIAKRSILFFLELAKDKYGLKEVHFLIEPDNIASLKLAEKLRPEKKTKVNENGQQYLTFIKILN